MKIGIVGMGETGQLHLNTWSKIKGIHVVGKSGNLNQLVHEEEFQDLLTSDVDVIDLCLPVDLQMEYIKKAAISGKHIICDMLALKHDRSRAIKEVCKENHVRLFINNVLRFSPEYKHVYTQITKGAIGVPGVARISNGATTQEESAVVNGGASIQRGIAIFDWLSWTFGEVTRVMAKQVKRKVYFDRVIECVYITLRMDNGMIAYLELSTGVPEHAEMFEFTGNQGMLVHNNKESYPIKLNLFDADKEHVTLPDTFQSKTPLQNQFEHFIACLLDKEEQPNSRIEDTYKILDLASAITESINTGQAITLNSKGGM